MMCLRQYLHFSCIHAMYFQWNYNLRYLFESYLLYLFIDIYWNQFSVCKISLINNLIIIITCALAPKWGHSFGFLPLKTIMMNMFSLRKVRKLPPLFLFTWMNFHNTRRKLCFPKRFLLLFKDAQLPAYFLHMCSLHFPHDATLNQSSSNSERRKKEKKKGRCQVHKREEEAAVSSV